MILAWIFLIVALCGTVGGCYAYRLTVRERSAARRDELAAKQALQYLENEGMSDRVRLAELANEKASIEQQTANIRAAALTEQLRLVGDGKAPKMKEAARSVADGFRGGRVSGRDPAGSERPAPGAEEDGSGVVDEASAAFLDQAARELSQQIVDLQAIEARQEFSRQMEVSRRMAADVASFQPSYSASRPAYYGATGYAGDGGVYARNRRHPAVQITSHEPSGQLGYSCQCGYHYYGPALGAPTIPNCPNCHISWR